MLTGVTRSADFYDNLTTLILRNDFKAVQHELLDIISEGLTDFALDAARLQYFEVVNYLLQNHLPALKAKVGDILPWALENTSGKGMPVVDTLVRVACSFIPETKFPAILFYLDGHRNRSTIADLIYKVGAVSFTAEQLNLALESAAKVGDVPLVELILICMKEGKNPKTKAFEFAIDAGHLKVLERLVESEHWGKKERLAAYRYAAKKGLVEIVEVFFNDSLSKGHHIKAMKKAAKYGHHELATMIAQRNDISPGHIEQMISNMNRKLRSLIVLQDRLSHAPREKLEKQDKRKPMLTHEQLSAVELMPSEKYLADALDMLRGATAYNRRCLINGLIAAVRIHDAINLEDFEALLKAVPRMQACNNELSDECEVVLSDQDMEILLNFARASERSVEEKLKIYSSIISLVCVDLREDADFLYLFITELMNSNSNLAFRILDKTWTNIATYRLTEILKRAVELGNVQIVCYLIEHRGFPSSGYRHYGGNDPVADCIRKCILASDTQMFYAIVHHRNIEADTIRTAFKEASRNGELVVVRALYNETSVCRDPKLITKVLSTTKSSEVAEYLESILEEQNQVQHRAKAADRESLDLQRVEELADSLEDMGMDSGVEQDEFLQTSPAAIVTAFNMSGSSADVDSIGENLERSPREKLTASK